jgi:hypothetical protein
MKFGVPHCRERENKKIDEEDHWCEEPCPTCRKKLIEEADEDDEEDEEDDDDEEKDDSEEIEKAEEGSTSDSAWVTEPE